jgi:hypothetical protein
MKYSFQLVPSCEDVQYIIKEFITPSVKNSKIQFDKCLKELRYVSSFKKRFRYGRTLLSLENANYAKNEELRNKFLKMRINSSFMKKFKISMIIRHFKNSLLKEINLCNEIQSVYNMFPSNVREKYKKKCLFEHQGLISDDNNVIEINSCLFDSVEFGEKLYNDIVLFLKMNIKTLKRKLKKYDFMPYFNIVCLWNDSWFAVPLTEYIMEYQDVYKFGAVHSFDYKL